MTAAGSGGVRGGVRDAGVAWWALLGTLVLLVAWALLPGAVVLAADTSGLPGWFMVSSVLALVPGAMVVGCFLWIAELVRRGEIRRNPAPRGRVLPAATNVSSVHMLSLPVHTAWFAGMTAGGTGLLLPAPWYGGDGAFATWWVLGFGLTLSAGAALGSLVKKAAWSRHLGRRAGRRSPAAPSAFWRWVSFRWRLDLWACAAGFAALAVGMMLLVAMTTTSEDFGSAEDVAEATTVVAWLLGGGVVVLAAGLWAGTQFWRSGEDLAGGESFA